MKRALKTSGHLAALATLALIAGLPKSTASAQPNCPPGTYPVPVGSAGLTAVRAYDCVRRGPAPAAKTNQPRKNPAQSWKWVGKRGQKQGTTSNDAKLGSTYTQSMSDGPLKGKTEWAKPPADTSQIRVPKGKYGVRWRGNQ